MGYPLSVPFTAGHRLGPYVIDGGERIRISNGGGLSPRWHPSGDEIFYWAGSSLMSARRRPGGRWSALPVADLFRRADTIDAFDVGPSGETFVIAERRGAEDDRHLQIILGQR